jgi:DNA gyrase subunit A
VVEIKRDAMANVVLSHLYKYTPLQTSYGINNVALLRGRPVTLSLRELIDEFIRFRLEVIVRRTRFDLNKALSRAHILVGLLIALDYIDKIIDLIRGSATPDLAKEGLMKGEFVDDKEAFWAKFGTLISSAATDELFVEAGNVLSEAQAKAILELRLQRLTGLERDKIKAEYDELLKSIAHLKAILESEELQKSVVKDELLDIRERYGDARRTEVSYAEGDISIEDMIGDEDVVITISHLGYVKRTPMTEYRTQSRGGRGSRGVKTRDEDFVEHMFVASNHNYLLFFTELGKCHWLRVYEIPEATKTSSGRVIQNILNISPDDKVRAYIIIKDLTDVDFVNNHFIVLATRKGIIKKTPVEAFSRPRSGGINAITINEGDRLLEARLTDGNREILMAVNTGFAIRFHESAVRSMGRSAAGVRGVSLQKESDFVVGMITVDPANDQFSVLVVSENGNGKRSPVEEYRLTNRGGKGVKTMQVTAKTGALIAIKSVTDTDDLMITTRSGIMIRMAVSELRVMGRATQGVRVIRLDEGDQISDVAVVRQQEEKEEEDLTKF